MAGVSFETNVKDICIKYHIKHLQKNEEGRECLRGWNQPFCELLICGGNFDDLKEFLFIYLVGILMI